MCRLTLLTTERHWPEFYKYTGLAWGVPYLRDISLSAELGFVFMALT